MLKRNIFTLFFVGWVLFLTTLSLFSFSDLDTGTVKIPYADKITHFIFYFIFATLACMALRERSRGQMDIGNAMWYGLVSAITYGIIIEVLQYTLTDDRMAELGDVIANTLGAIAGVLLIKWYFSKERQLKWRF
nr:VanZ family protein [Allomuricauda sp.]